MKKKTKPERSKRETAAPGYRPFAKLSKELAGRAKRAPEAPTEATKPKRAAREVEAAEGEPKREGDLTFEEHMRGVRPLGARAVRIPKSASRLERTATKGAEVDHDAPARERLHALVSDAIRFEVTDDGTCLEGRRLSVDPRELRRLRTQRYAVDGQLDLHGMKALEARGALTKFLAKRASEGDRAVLVVHGKGSHSPRGDAVLRGEIGAWLSQGAAARHVLAFASVVDRAGESGSLFVLLTR